MMNSFLKASELYLYDFLDLVHLNSGNRNYTKFIILGRSRVGSNMLRSILNSHREIISFGELFRTQGEVGWGIPYYWHNRINLFGEDDYLENRPIDFLQKRIFKNYPDRINAVGFKLFYYHAKQDNWKQIWDYIKGEKIKIIHLKRRNLLKVHLSRELAERTGSWVNKKYNTAIALDPQKCARDFERTERWWSEYDRYFEKNTLLEVWFEDIVADSDLWIAKIMDFLDISSSEKKLTPTTKRQSAKTAAGLISNYEEVKKEFIGTKWEHLFE